MSLSRSLRRAFPILLTLLFGCEAANALTVTSDNGIIYDIIGTTQTVTISASNKGSDFLKQTDVYLVIPEKVIDTAGSAGTNRDEYTVVSMAPGAFQNCTGLKSIEIQAPITAVDYATFDGCTGLMSVILPNSVETIGNEAFQNCSALISINGFSSLTRCSLSARDWKPSTSRQRNVASGNICSVSATDSCRLRSPTGW